MSVAPLSLAPLRRGWNRFFHEPVDTRICGILRIAYASVLLVNVLVWAPDLERWFAETGVLPLKASRFLVDPESRSIFEWLAPDAAAVWTCYLLLVLQILLLGAGLWPRFQAAGVFLWLVSFQHRNMLLWDGQDSLFRLFAFFLIFLPSDRFLSADAWRRRAGRAPRDLVAPAFALRFFQIQMTIMYLAAGWEKLAGTDWPAGVALYYVARLDDFFGHYPAPEFLFAWMPLVGWATWAVLAGEIVLPFAFWFRETRLAAVILAFLFHLGLEWTMNLFLFPWIAMVGLLSFLEPSDLDALGIPGGARSRGLRWRRPSARAGDEKALREWGDDRGRAAPVPSPLGGEGLHRHGNLAAAASPGRGDADGDRAVDGQRRARSGARGGGEAAGGIR